MSNERTKADSLSPEGRKERESRRWCSECFLSLFSDIDMENLIAQGMEYIRKRQVLDFFVSRGRVSAKVRDEPQQYQSVEIVFPQFSDEDWDRILNRLAGEAFYIAKILAGRMPSEVQRAFRFAGVTLFPNSREELEILVDGEKVSDLAPQTAAVICRLCEVLDSDPFAVLLLRGRGKEETLLEVRDRRSALRSTHDLRNPISYQQVQYEPAPPLAETLDRFWSAGSDLRKISYSIKADELPASVLKRLEPLPLSGLEDEVDFLLEQAYVQVAKRAQAFGLGLRS